MRKIPFLLLILLCTLLVGCDKHLFDYRRKFVGAYHMTTTVHTWEMGVGNFDTVVSYDGVVEYGTEDKILMVQRYTGEIVPLEVDRKGKLSICSTGAGSISKSSLHLNLNDNMCGQGPNGYNYEEEIFGNRE